MSKRATVECWACRCRVQWDKAARVIALREIGQPEHTFCSACMSIIDAGRIATKQS